MCNVLFMTCPVDFITCWQFEWESETYSGDKLLKMKVALVWSQTNPLPHFVGGWTLLPQLQLMTAIPAFCEPRASLLTISLCDLAAVLFSQPVPRPALMSASLSSTFTLTSFFLKLTVVHHGSGSRGLNTTGLVNPRLFLVRKPTLWEAHVNNSNYTDNLSQLLTLVVIWHW